jgi:hypothetical protein
MKYAFALFCCAMLGCGKPHECPEITYRADEAVSFSWVPYKSTSSFVLYADTGAAVSLSFDYWHVTHDVGGYVDEDKGLCGFAVYYLSASTVELPGSNSKLLIGFHGGPTDLILGGHHPSVYNESLIEPLDSLAEYLPIVALNGTTYEDVVHCKSDSIVGVDEFYYTKDDGLVYYRQAGSPYAWRKL